MCCFQFSSNLFEIEIRDDDNRSMQIETQTYSSSQIEQTKDRCDAFEMEYVYFDHLFVQTYFARSTR